MPYCSSKIKYKEPYWSSNLNYIKILLRLPKFGLNLKHGKNQFETWPKFMRKIMYLKIEANVKVE
jgi:CRISPR/Cas system CSM-associated protein Csm4 (group 5 of RAMP superfamily)